MNKIDELIEECDIEFDKYTNKATFHKNEIIGLMKEYAEYCMNHKQRFHLSNGSCNIDDYFGYNKKEVEQWIKNVKHE